MENTLLHKAAVNNQIKALKFLLELEGDEKLNLEAKNMDGETPLHVAAKNGCARAVKLLLKYNANKHAKNYLGKTPLQLAVDYVQAGSMATVEVLLESTDLDEEAIKSALNKLLTRTCNCKQQLYNLLQSYLDRFQSSKSVNIIDALEVALEPIVGLEGLKSQLRRWAKGTMLNDKRRALGCNVPVQACPPHMAFLGSPGTGKTMIARLLADLLYKVGVLKKNKVVEVQRTDLVGKYVGQTGHRTRKKIEEAEGGVLFVDEAYRLMPTEESSWDYGKEALEEIMSFMDTGKVVVIFAGYPEPMQHVFGANEGFRRRVTWFFHFDDFSCMEIAQMVHLKMEEKKEDSVTCGFKLAKNCTVEAIEKLLEIKTTEKQRQLLNGGLVELLLANAQENLNERLDLNCQTYNANQLSTITLKDLGAAILLLPQI